LQPRSRALQAQGETSVSRGKRSCQSTRADHFLGRLRLTYIRNPPNLVSAQERVQRRREGQGQHAAGFRGQEDAVVPQAGRA
jgi:hypothetical protein